MTDPMDSALKPLQCLFLPRFDSRQQGPLYSVGGDHFDS